MKYVHIGLWWVCLILWWSVISDVSDMYKDYLELQPETAKSIKINMKERKMPDNDVAHDKVDSNIVKPRISLSIEQKEDSKAILPPELNLVLDKTDKNEVIYEPKVIEVEAEVWDTHKNKQPIPSTFSHKLPFYPQAPYWDWNQPRQDACEEASIILTAYGIKNKSLSLPEFKNEILTLVRIQNDMFWSYVDTTIQQTKKLYDVYYWVWATEILYNPTVKGLKEKLSSWHVIIAPFAWKLLGNIYYSNWWPRYHMLVIIWYDQTWFYTHDVGTKNWASYWYEEDILLHALHDFVPISWWDIINWEKKVLLVSKNNKLE